MVRGLFLTLSVATLSACSLLANFQDLTGGVLDEDAAGDAAVAVVGSGDATTIDATPPFDDATTIDAPDDLGTDAGASLAVVQHHVCGYKTLADSFPCAFPATNVAGNAVLVHFYYNFGEATLLLNKLTDNGGNIYSFLDVGNAGCPAGALANEVCCTTAAASNGTCQGWALATNVALPASKVVTITFVITSAATPNDVMGADVFEIRGLANDPYDQGSAASLPVGAAISTPSVTTVVASELVFAGVAFYTSTSTMTPPSGWTMDQDTGYFSAALFQTAGPTGSTYGGSSMGTITGMTKLGTTTIVALKGQ